MNREQSIQILKQAFSHYMFEENVIIEGIRVALYFPSLGVVVTEAEEFSPKFINITVKEEGNDIGRMINDILLDAEFLAMRTPDNS